MKLVVGCERDGFERRPKSAVGGEWIRCSVDIKALYWQVVGCELGGGQKICVGSGGGGAIDVIGIIVVDQLKALDLDLNNIIHPTPIRRTGHFFCVPCLTLLSPNLIRHPLPLKR